jgi:hypothetical protein
LASIIFRTLSGVTPKRFAASAVLMILIAQSISFKKKLSCAHDKFLDKRKSTSHSHAHQKSAGWQVLVTLANPTQPTPFPLRLRNRPFLIIVTRRMLRSMLRSGSSPLSITPISRSWL